MAIDIDTNIRILNADSIRSILSGGTASGSGPTSADTARAAMYSMPWAAGGIARDYQNNAMQARAIADFVKAAGANKSGSWSDNGDFWKRQMSNAVGQNDAIRSFNLNTADAQRNFVEAMNRLAKAGFSTEEAFQRVRETMNIGNWSTGQKSLSDQWASFKEGYNRIFDISKWGGKAGDKDGQAHSFATAFFRVMASRSLMGVVNAGFEYAKNPLQDNYNIERSQRASNSFFSTAAATGRIDLALVSAVTSLVMSSIERRNLLHVQKYQFDQSQLDTRRTFAQQRSDWSFNQLLGMYSRGEQQDMLQARADRIRGFVTTETLAEDAKNEKEKEKSSNAAVKGEQAIQKAVEATTAAKKEQNRVFAQAGSASSAATGTASGAARSAKPSAGVSAATQQAVRAIPIGPMSRVLKENRGFVDRLFGNEPARKESSGGERTETPIRTQNENEVRLGAKLGANFRQREEIENAYKQSLVEALDDAKTNKGSGDVAVIRGLQKKLRDIQKKREDTAEALEQLSRAADEALVDKKVADRNDAAEAASSTYQAGPAGRRSGGPKEYRPVGMRSGAPTGGPRSKPEGDPKAYVDPNETAKYHYGKGVKSYLSNSQLENLAKEAEAAQAAYAKQTGNQSVTIGSRIRGFSSGLFSELEKAKQSDLSKSIESVFEKSDFRKSELEKVNNSKEKFDPYFGQRKNLEKELGKEFSKITIADIQKLSSDPNASTTGSSAAHYFMRAVQNDSSLDYVQKKKSIKDSVEAGTFNKIDLASLNAALDIANEEGLDTDKGNWKKVKEMALMQQRRAEQLEFQKFQSKYDINQVMGQYTDANRVTDVMAKQGFFIGSQVDVQDVNKDILSEVRKMLPLLSKMAGKEAGFSDVGFLTNTNFK